MTDEPVIEIRAASAPPTVAEGRRITGHFARFGSFNEIDSAVEGRFLERIEPGAFARTLKNNRAGIRMLFQHGRDPQIGDKPIGAPDVLREDRVGPYFEAELFDSVPDLIVDGLRAGQYGISYRFSVIDEDWDRRPTRSDYNPEGIPERTIKQARVYEFGPVTFPADPRADYAVRALSITDLDALPTGPAPEAHSEGTRGTSTPTPQKETPLEPKYFSEDEFRARIRELSELIERDASVPGRLPEAAQVAFDAAVQERAELEAELAAWLARKAQVRTAAEDTKKVEPTYAPTAHIVRKTESDIYDMRSIQNEPDPERRSLKLRDSAMRAAEQMRVEEARFDQDKSRERLQSLLDHRDSDDKELARLVLTTNSPAYRAAFDRYVRTSGQERAAALAVGVDGTGGYSVPVSFDPTIVATGAWAAINPIRATARTETIVGTDTWQALTANAVVAAYATEAAAATEQGPTFTRPEFVVKRAHAFVTVSYEMMQDRPSLAADLGVLFGEAKDNLEETQFTTGTGATVYPQGIGLKDAFTRVDSVTNDTVAVADVLATEAALPIRHRFGAAWYMSRAAIRAIQAWETTGGQLFNSTNGYPAVGNPTIDRGGNTGMTLLGYPVYEAPSMPWTPTTDDTTTWVLGNLSKNYVIVDRVGMSIKVIPDMLNGATPSFPTGEAGIYAFWRNTARVLNADGARQGAVQ